MLFRQTSTKILLKPYHLRVVRKTILTKIGMFSENDAANSKGYVPIKAHTHVFVSCCLTTAEFIILLQKITS